MVYFLSSVHSEMLYLFRSKDEKLLERFTFCLNPSDDLPLFNFNSKQNKD